MPSSSIPYFRHACPRVQQLRVPRGSYQWHLVLGCEWPKDDSLRAPLFMLELNPYIHLKSVSFFIKFSMMINRLNKTWGPQYIENEELQNGRTSLNPQSKPKDAH